LGGFFYFFGRGALIGEKGVNWREGLYCREIFKVFRLRFLESVLRGKRERLFSVS
jgi:hypothetical protein